MFNLARATGVAADQPKSRWATLLRRIIDVPARRHHRPPDHLHLPADWPWAPGWEWLWATATDPPAATAA